MKEITDEQIVEAAKRTGFALEFQVADVFSRIGGIVTPNCHLEYDRSQNQDGTDQVTAEIDVLFEPYLENNQTPSFYLAECKGTESSNKLILIGSARKAPAEYNRVELKNKKIQFNDSRIIYLQEGKGHDLCTTGDFFTLRQGQLAKIGANDEKHNLYKALSQLIEGISAFASKGVPNRYEQRAIEIIPLIVTNCEICVVTFKPANGATTNREVKWALLKNEIVFSSGPLSKEENWIRTKYGSVNYRLNVPWVWVVNVNHLKQFVNTNDRRY